MTEQILHKDLTNKIIKCFYNVYNELGGGFLESVYEKSLSIEFEKMNLSFENQRSLDVYYKNKLVGEFIADVVVEGKILIEIKAVTTLSPLYKAQLINYLKAAGIKIGFLVNFGAKLEFRRVIY
jgi:GxxExxY protein